MKRYSTIELKTKKEAKKCIELMTKELIYINPRIKKTLNNKYVVTFSLKKYFFN